MRVIDVDAHFYEPFDWLEQQAPELAALLPRLDPVARYRDYLGPRIPAASLEKFFGSVIERDLALGA